MWSFTVKCWTNRDRYQWVQHRLSSVVRGQVLLRCREAQTCQGSKLLTSKRSPYALSNAE
jgi:hypothetical protein